MQQTAASSIQEQVKAILSHELQAQQWDHYRALSGEIAGLLRRLRMERCCKACGSTELTTRPIASRTD